MTFPEPTERAVWIVAAIGAAGVVSSAVDALSPAVAASLGLVFVAFVVDTVLSGDPRAARVHREVSHRWRQGEPQLVRVVVEFPEPRVAEITDTPPPDATPREMTRHSDGAMAAFSLDYDVTARTRGEVSFGRVAVRTKGPLGLVVRRARHVVDDVITVTPHLERIMGRAERLLRGDDGGLARRHRRLSDGREFDTLRDYRRGDDVRFIDWKASARRSSMVVKTMRPEPRQDIAILVDTGRHVMGHHEARDGGGTRLDAGIETALVLASAALSVGDRVSVTSFAGVVGKHAGPVSGRGQLQTLAAALTDVNATPEEPDYAAALRFFLARQKRRALVVVVTDVLDVPSARALTRAVSLIRARHVPMVVSVADAAWTRLADADPDPSLRQAAQRTLAHRRRALSAVSAAGATVVDGNGAATAARAVMAYLDAKSQGRF